MEPNRTIKMSWAAGLPEAWRYFSIAFHRWRMIGVAVGSVVFCLFFIALIAITEKISAGLSGKGMAYDLVFIIFIYHLAILWLYFPARASLSIAREWRDKTWVFQQTTPQGAIRLLLGRIVGAPADGYIALAATWPILLGFLIASPLSVTDFFLAYIVAVIFSVAFSLMSFYFAVYVGQSSSRQEHVYVLPLAIMYALSMPLMFTMQQISNGRLSNFSSIFNLTPYSLFFVIFNHKHLTVPFFIWDFPLFPAMAVFYAVWLVWFLIASAAQLNQRMSSFSSRLPLLGLLLWLVLLVEGGIYGAHAHNLPRELALGILSSFLLFLLYGVMVIHSRPLQEIRPWLYQWKEKAGAITYYFRTDSPVIITFIILQALCLLVLAVDASLPYDQIQKAGAGLNYVAHQGQEVNVPLMLLAFFSVTLRDCLLIQYWRLNREKKDGVLMLIYLVAFIAVPGLVNAAADHWVLDLTFINVYNLAFRGSQAGIGLVSIPINLIVSAGLAVLTWRLIDKAYHGLPPELSAGADHQG
jgi:hypothetical protein